MRHRSIIPPFVAWLVVACPGSAQEASPTSMSRAPEKRPAWRYRKQDWLDLSVAASGTAGFVVLQFGVESPASPHWTGGVLFDESMRSTLRAPTEQGRSNASLISDGLWLTNQALLLASTTAPLMFEDGNWEATWQLAAINWKAASISAFLARLSHRTVGRQRPDVVHCDDPSQPRAEVCDSSPTSSFPSGHTTGAMLSAGLICAHQFHLKWFDGGAADIATCAGALAVGAGTGTMRVVADRHYVTDVLGGALLGLSAGWLLPSLWDYQAPKGSSATSTTVRWTASPGILADNTPGLAVLGVF